MKKLIAFCILLFMVSFAYAQTFVVEDDIDDGGSYNACTMSEDNAYIYTATASIGLGAYSFDGATLTNITFVDPGDSAEDVWVDSNGVIYLANHAGGLWAYTFNGAAFSLEDSDDFGNLYVGIWGDDSFIYVTTNNDIHAYSFATSTLTRRDTVSGLGLTEAVWGDGTYIYFAKDAAGLAARTFDGVSWSAELGSIDDGGTYEDVDGDGTYIYAACGTDGLRAYSFNGTTFTLLDTVDPGAPLDFGLGVDVGGNDDWIFYSNHQAGIYAYTFDGANFAAIDDIDVDGAGGPASHNESTHDGTYTYVACLADGLWALSGFITATSAPQVIFIYED
jgi:hypothetical protein